jgi:hypothetical protein
MSPASAFDQVRAFADSRVTSSSNPLGIDAVDFVRHPPLVRDGKGGAHVKWVGKPAWIGHDVDEPGEDLWGNRNSITACQQFSQ